MELKIYKSDYNRIIADCDDNANMFIQHCSVSLPCSENDDLTTDTATAVSDFCIRYINCVEKADYIEYDISSAGYIYEIAESSVIKRYVGSSLFLSGRYDYKDGRYIIVMFIGSNKYQKELDFVCGVLLTLTVSLLEHDDKIINQFRTMSERLELKHKARLFIESVKRPNPFLLK